MEKGFAFFEKPYHTDFKVLIFKLPYQLAMKMQTQKTLYHHIHLKFSQLISTSSMSGKSFSRDAANKAAIKIYRQKMATISSMISNILNMIDSQSI